MRQLPPDAASALRQMYLGNDEVSRLDYLVSREGMNALDAAGKYLGTTA
ncbi:hypothetical protein [Xanthomonas arboricola]